MRTVSPTKPFLLRSPSRHISSSIVTNTGKQRLLLGLFCSSLVSLLAYRRRSLSRSGIAGSIIAGTTTLGLGGWSWGLSLIYFFVSSSLFSHFRADKKAVIAADKFSKGGERDLAQVAANGGVATGLALCHGLTSSPRFQELLQAGYAGALATATADTWATEVGTLNSGLPRLITTGQKVAPGTSGGITAVGTGAATLGSLSLGIVFWLLQRCQPQRAFLPVLTLFSGLAGSMFDSLLGATIQAMYYCPACQKETERNIHSCGTETQPLRGLAWCNNDVVNTAATLFGALTAMVLYRIYTLFRKKAQQ